MVYFIIWFSRLAVAFRHSIDTWGGIRLIREDALFEMTALLSLSCFSCFDHET